MQAHQCKRPPNCGRGGPASTSLAAAGCHTAASSCLGRLRACHHQRSANGISQTWFLRQRQVKLCVSAGKGFGSAAKNPKPPPPRPSKAAKETVDFQDLMITWDKTLEHLYEDPKCAADIVQAAQSGYQQLGRGFVFVRAEVADLASRNAKAAVGTRQGTPLSCDADLLLNTWSCDYVPASELEQLGGMQGAGAIGIAVPTASDLTQPGSSMEVLAELQRAMRGMDPQQLRALVGVDADGAQATQPAAAAMSSDDGPGQSRQYEPDANEAAVLLLVRVNGVPAIGSDLARTAQTNAGAPLRLVSDELPEEWQ